MILGSIVLAGGQSRRMGTPKEFLRWRDSTLLHETVLVLLDCSYPVAVVARDEHQELPPLHTECDLVFDTKAGEGPLVGIEAGMEHIAARCDAAFVVGCDAPFVTTRSIGWLADQLGGHDAVVPQLGDEVQPLFAVYRTSTLPIVHELVAAGERRARALPDAIRSRGGKLRLLTEAEVSAFDPERRFLRNVNTAEDYDRARRESGL